MARRSPADGAAAWRKLEGLLAKGDLSPFYVFFGEGRYFVGKAARRVKERILPAQDRCELLFHSLTASEVSGAEIAELGRSTPFFDETQMILVRDADKLKERDQKDLLAYAKDPAPFTHMVFLAGEKFPKGELFSLLKQKYSKGCVGFPQLKRPACAAWVREMAKEKGLERRLSTEILEGLVETGLTSLGSVERQLEVLALNAGDLGKDGAAESPPFGMPEIALQHSYLFTDPLLAGKLEDALPVLNRLIDQGVPPLMLLGRVAWEIRRVRNYKEEMARGPVSDAFLRSNRIQPFKKARYASAAQRLSWEALEEMFCVLGEVDRRLKSSRLDPRLHLEAVCERIARLMVSGKGRSSAA